MSVVWSAADIARATRLPGSGVLLMIQCFFDDSGTHDRSECAVWGGVVGTIEQFQCLEPKWIALLRAPPHNKPALKKFGLADCCRGMGEFDGYNDAESDHLIYCFRNIIIRSGIVPIAYGTDVAAWDRHITGPLRSLVGRAESASYGYCAKIALQIAKEHNDQISIVFDQGRKSAVLEALYEGACAIVPDGAKMAAQTFVHVEASPGLQAADMIATSFYWHALDLMKDANAKPDPHLSRLLEGCPETTFGMFRDPEVLDVATKMIANRPWLASP